MRAGLAILLDARFPVVGPNFSCGSSREQAVWGLVQFGVRAVIGTSFNDNANNNGLLLIELDPAAIARLMERASDPAGNSLTVDLPAQCVKTSEGQQFAFDVTPTELLR